MHRMPVSLHKTPQTPLRLGHAGAWVAPQGKHYPPHQHVTWEIIYYRTGHIQCPVGDEVYQSQPGMVLLTPPHTVHSEYAVTAFSNYFIAIDAPADHPWPRTCLDDTENTFGNLCRAIVRESGGHAPEREEMLALLLNQLDILLRRAQEQQRLPEAERLVREVEHLLAERGGSPITIRDIAREVGVSPSYLRAQFSRLRGRSPMDYLQDVRLQHALAMLHNSNSSLSTIASLCGYDSASHLSRYVKRATGKSPGSLRPEKIGTAPTDTSKG